MRATKTLTYHQMQYHIDGPTVTNIRTGKVIDGQVTVVSVYHYVAGYIVFENYEFCKAKEVYALRQFGVSATAKATGDVISFGWVRGTDSFKMLELHEQLITGIETLTSV